ncbi:hypothetical protein V2J09_024140 [Rumex salicifolius]
MEKRYQGHVRRFVTALAWGKYILVERFPTVMLPICNKRYYFLAQSRNYISAALGWHCGEISLSFVYKSKETAFFSRLNERARYADEKA